MRSIATWMGMACALWLAAGCGDDAASDASSGTGGGDAATGTGTGTGGAASTTAATTSGGAPTIDVEPALTLGEGRTVQAEVDATDPDGGEPTLAVQGPEGIEAQLAEAAIELHALHGAAGGAVVVTATDDEGEVASAEVDVAVAPLAWTERVEWTTEGPEPREHATVLVDDVGRSIYVLFGSGYSPYLEPLGDAWRFDAEARTWHPCTLEGDVPPPGGSKRLAGSRGQPEGILYGGYGEGNQAFGEVYRVTAAGDVITFEELPQENPPGIRLLHVFGYDPATDTYAMYGGASSVLNGDTWTMRVLDGAAQWTQIDAGLGFSGPPARYGAFFGMDEGNGRLIVFSGQTSQTAFGQDTWVLDMRAEGGPAWSQVTQGASPPGRRNGTSVWDPTGPRLFVFGGTSDGATSQPGLFVLDARPGREAWTQLDREGMPPMRSSGFGAVVADDQGGAVWMGFGNDDDVYRDFNRLGY